MTSLRGAPGRRGITPGGGAPIGGIIGFMARLPGTPLAPGGPPCGGAPGAVCGGLALGAAMLGAGAPSFGNALESKMVATLLPSANPIFFIA